MRLEIFLTKTRREIFPKLRAVFAGKYIKSSLQRVQISTKFVYLKLAMLDLSSVPINFLETLVCVVHLFDKVNIFQYIVGNQLVFTCQNTSSRYKYHSKIVSLDCGYTVRTLMGTTFSKKQIKRAALLFSGK